MNKYWRSKIPLWLVLLFLLNIFLVVAVELLVLYPYPAQPNTAGFSRIDPVYENCRIVSQDSVSHMNAYLLKTAQGENHLVVLRRHSFVLRRADALYSDVIELPEQGETAVAVRTGFRTSELTVGADGSISITFAAVPLIRDSAAWYMALGAILEALELALWHLIKHGLG